MEAHRKRDIDSMLLARYTPPPGHPLHGYIDLIWRLDNQFAYTGETILPKQTVDILFNLGAPEGVAHSQHGSTFVVDGFHVAGPQTGAISVRPQGAVHLLGVSLKMEACAALLALPMTELTDQTVDGLDLFPQQRFLWEQLAETPAFAAQCVLLMQWLLSILTPSPQIDLLQQACWALREQPTSHTLDQLATHLHLSARHLRRLMLRDVGIGPAQYLRLSRFVKSLYLMPKASSLTELAHHIHYADQAHFCRDFKEIAGMTPHEYRQRASQVPGHLFAA